MESSGKMIQEKNCRPTKIHSGVTLLSQSLVESIVKLNEKAIRKETEKILVRQG